MRLLDAVALDPITTRSHSSAVAWDRFERDLLGELRHLGAGQTLLLGVIDLPRYVQFAGYGTHQIRAETVSNVYLTGGDRLSPADDCRLACWGWRRPTHAPGDPPTPRTRRGSPNYFIDVHPADAHCLVRLVAHTFRLIHQVADPAALNIEEA